MRSRLRLCLPALLCFALLCVAAPGHPQQLNTKQNARLLAAAPGRPNSSSAAKYAPGRLLVRFRPGIQKSSMGAAHAAQGAEVIRAYRVVENLQLVRLPAGVSPEQAARAYRQNPAVLYAEPDYIYHADQSPPVTPNDPRFGELWGLHNTGQPGGTADADIDAPEAWAITTGSSNVVVGIIDTGIDYNHEDLSANMFRNAADCNSNGVDDDGNGFVDDCYGINPIYGNSDPMDDAGHGTHVAGTIGAVGNNGVGVVGVNWQVKLIACKFLNGGGSGPTSAAVTCLEYLATMKDRGVNIVATNNSWGGGGFSQALLDAIDAHRQRGILFIAAAGNSNRDNDSSGQFPASYYLPNIISVASTTSLDARSSFSSFGRHSVHLGAPGSSILSTTPGNTYSTLSGTSMATPHVTGVAALLKAQDPTRDWKAIKNLLIAGGDTIPSMASTISQKRLNARGAMTCSNSIIQARVLPRAASINAAAGLPVDLAVLHINCATPNGSVTVSLDSGAQTITLLDDGLGADQEAGDGIYTARWVPLATGAHTLTFPGGDIVNVQVLMSYQFSTSVPFNYRTITGTALGMFDDDSRQITSPFPIQFGGGSFTSLFVNSNGNITFAGSFFDYVNDSIPTSSTQGLVAPFWDDLFPPGNGDVFWEATGTAPNRELVVEWRDVGHYDCRPGTVKFQVVFFEASSDILFNYADTIFTPSPPPCSEPVDAGGSATVGVQVGAGAGTQFSFDTPSLGNDTAIRWQIGPSTPAIARLAPFTALTGDPAFTLKVLGSGFLGTSVVRWNGGDRTTNFISTSELRASIPASDLAAPGTAQVAVFSPPPLGTGASASLDFAVYSSYPVASLTSLAPSSAIAGDPGITLTATGTQFVTSSVLRWNGADRPTTVSSSTQLAATIPATDLTSVGTAQVTVFNPTPGGGVSNALTVTIGYPVPSLSVLSPQTVLAGSSGFTLNVVGTGYNSASVLRWNGSDRPTHFFTDFYLTADIPASDVANAGTAQITVFNPAPGGGTSPPYDFIIEPPPPVPTLTSVAPPNVGAGGPAFTLTANGSGFTGLSVVRWNGNDRPTIRRTGTWLEASIPAGDIAATGTVQATVYTPAPGGGTSQPLTVNIMAPPANDQFSNRMVVPTSPFTQTVDTRGAIQDPADPVPSCSTVRGSTVWYSFTLPAAGAAFTVDTFGSDYDTVLSAWTGAPGSFVSAGCNDNDGGPQSRLRLTSTTVTTYQFMVSSDPLVGGGRLVLNLAVEPSFSINMTGPTSATVQRGGMANFTFTVSPQFGTLSNPINFTCPNLAFGLSCSFSPNNFTPGANPTNVTLSVSTSGMAAQASPAEPKPLFAFWFALPLVGLLLTPALARRGRNKARLGFFLTLLLLLALAGLQAACGGGSPPPPPPPPPQTFTITVQGTSGTVTVPFAVTLTVTQ